MSGDGLTCSMVTPMTVTTLSSCLTTCPAWPERAQHWPGPVTGWRICEGEGLTCQTDHPNTVRSCPATGWGVVRGVLTMDPPRNRLAQSTRPVRSAENREAETQIWLRLEGGRQSCLREARTILREGTRSAIMSVTTSANSRFCPTS